MISERFGQLLRQLRRGQGAKATVVASTLGIHDNYLFFLEKGKRLPGVELLVKMAQIYDCNETWLFQLYLMTCLSWKEETLRRNFERLSGKRYGLKLPTSRPSVKTQELPPPPSFRKFDERSGLPLRPGWSDPLRKIGL